MLYDVIIVGLGAMGSAAAYHFARRGARVLGLDRFAPPHAFGSSHGESRIIREAYFEHPLYVPLVQRAYALWRELEREAGTGLLLQTGGLMIGQREGTLVRGARASARAHHLPHELLDSAALRSRYPAFQVAEGVVALWEPRAGVLFPEKCIAAHLHVARRHGADLRFNEAVVSWRQTGAACEVQTGRGAYGAAHLVFTAGPWLAGLQAGLALPLQCARQVLFWFEPGDQKELFMPPRFPVFIFEYAPERYFYGFPDLGEGVKVAIHHEGERAAPEMVRREVQAAEARPVRELLNKHLPALAPGALRKSEVCLYTNTPDGHFLMDFHPGASRVLLASPCSGHGFKFSSAMGEGIAQLLLENRAQFDFSPFRLARFG